MVDQVENEEVESENDVEQTPADVVADVFDLSDETITTETKEDVDTSTEDVTSTETEVEEKTAETETTETSDTVETDQETKGEETTPATQEVEKQVEAPQEIDVVEALKTFYAIPEELASDMDVEPSKYLPELAAKLHLSILQSVQEALPQTISQTVETRDLSSQREQQFFEVNPHLKGHEEDVVKYAQAYLQVNPGVDVETAIKQIGVMTTVALGLEQPQQEEVKKPVKKQVPHKPSTATSTGSEMVQNEFDVVI